MSLKKITLFAFAVAMLASAAANAQFGRPGHGPGHGGPGWGGPGHGPGHGGPGWGGRPHPGPGPGYPPPRPNPGPFPYPNPYPNPNPGWPGGGGGGGGWGHVWAPAGTQCGPYQPWGTSLQCPSTNPNGGPSGMSCNGIQPGTRCFGASYYNPSYACTSPYNGQTQYGSYIFNMYVCR